jgi:integrase
VKRLLNAVRGSEIETAVRIQLYCGLRIGEVQALQWSHVDFRQGKYGKLRIAGTYVRKEHRFKDSPKGGEQHSIDLPLELGEYLLLVHEQTQSLYVASQHPTDFLNYQTYFHALKRVCRLAKIP